MSRYKPRTRNPNEDVYLSKAKRAFVELKGLAAANEHIHEIAALPSKDWKGTKVYQLRCCGETGKGPHDVWLPERVLWALISFDRYRCAFR